jgi:hypothetical protein
MKNKLITLLLNNDYLFDFDTTIIKDQSLVDKNALYTIYKRRLMTSDKVSQSLVDNIKLSKGDKIKLITISDKYGNEFLVFTNEEESALIGVIKII